MAYDKRKMQDIKYSEKESFWEQYKTLYAAGNFAGITALLESNPDYKYKVLNAYNWNRLINLISDKTTTTPATTDSIEGAWNDDFESLQTAWANFKFRYDVNNGVWQSGTAYKKNNLVKTTGGTPYASYFCIKDIPSPYTKALTDTEYWMPAQVMLESIGIPVSVMPPENLRIGDLWLQDESSTEGFCIVSTNATNVSVDLNNPAIVVDNSVSTFRFTPNQGYALPDTITVTGATLVSWTKSTGTAIIRSSTNDITITVAGELITYNISTNLSNCAGGSGNPTTTTYAASKSLTFTANNGYVLPDSISVTGAQYTWDKTSGTLTLTNAISDISITIIAQETFTFSGRASSSWPGDIDVSFDNGITWQTTSIEPNTTFSWSGIRQIKFRHYAPSSKLTLTSTLTGTLEFAPRTTITSDNFILTSNITDATIRIQPA